MQTLRRTELLQLLEVTTTGSHNEFEAHSFFPMNLLAYSIMLEC